eukprot:TRINITY_DN9459_c0_g1_i1.p1 TRINITY_DN9459_c0_g1~~TRINITY_DN9459_c0_g1_i1.p1  ORF type:complete len:1199 (-),score=217.68 TRINITY_DN9459_c0_g1_i1:155-3751(-)
MRPPPLTLSDLTPTAKVGQTRGHVVAELMPSIAVAAGGASASASAGLGDFPPKAGEAQAVAARTVPPKLSLPLNLARPGTSGSVPRSARAGGSGSAAGATAAAGGAVAAFAGFPAAQPLTARPNTSGPRPGTSGFPGTGGHAAVASSLSGPAAVPGARRANSKQGSGTKPMAKPASVEYESPPRSAPAVLGPSGSSALLLGGLFTPRPDSTLTYQHSDLDGVTPCELRHNRSVRLELEELRLSEHFDHRGAPHFRRLGVAVPARKTPQVKATFGSYVKSAPGEDRKGGPKEEEDEDASIAKRMIRARAHRLAFEAVEQDAKKTSRMIETMGTSLDEEDVRSRKLDLLFDEVPSFRSIILEDVKTDLHVPDATAEEERAARRACETYNRQLRDPDWYEGRRMGWLLTQEEAILLTEVAILWQKGARGANLAFGIDRPTFCRLCLDLELGDREKAPYFWMVSLFDASAALVRASEDSTLSTAPLVHVLSLWNFVGVMDKVLKQLYDRDTKHKFVKKLRVAVRARPSSLSDEMLAKPEEHLQPSSRSNTRAQRHGTVSKPKRAPTKGQAERQPARPSLDAPMGAFCFGQLGPMAECMRPSMDMQQEMLARERLVSSMLVEPEVLHLVVQHLEFYRTLHAAYADTEGKVTANALLQFCADFQVVPDLASTARAMRIYTSVVAARQAETSQDLASSNSIGPDGSLGVEAFVEVICKLGLFYLGFYGNVSQQSSTPYMRLVWLSAYLQQVAQSGLRNGGQSRWSEPETLAATLGRAIREAEPPTRLKPPELTQGGKAGAKTSDPPSGKTAKMRQKRFSKLTMGKTRAAMKKSRINGLTPLSVKSAPGGGEAKCFPKVVEDDSSDPDLHQEEEDGGEDDASSAAADNVGRQKMRTGPGRRRSAGNSTSGQTAGNDRRKLRQRACYASSTGEDDSNSYVGNTGVRRSQSMEVPDVEGNLSAPPSPKFHGGPEDDFCSLCQTNLTRQQWGRALCRACSIVDTTSLDNHPFRRLLRCQLKEEVVTPVRLEEFDGEEIMDETFASFDSGHRIRSERSDLKRHSHDSQYSQFSQQEHDVEDTDEAHPRGTSQQQRQRQRQHRTEEAPDIPNLRHSQNQRAHHPPSLRNSQGQKQNHQRHHAARHRPVLQLSDPANFLSVAARVHVPIQVPMVAELLPAPIPDIREMDRTVALFRECPVPPPPPRPLEATS